MSYNNTIKMHEEHLLKARNGMKTTTIRKGIKNYKLGIAYFKTEDNKLQTEVFVNKMEVLRYDELTDEHAARDGFESLKDLRKALETIYGEISSYTLMTIVHFDSKGQM